MRDADYHERAEQTLLRIEQAIEASGANVDFENAGDVLTLEFENGSKLIVNKQGAARQLWVAARSGGFHYDWDPTSGAWRNDQTGAELFAELSRLVSQQAGTRVDLA
jgi:CyaY protein